MSRFLTCSMLVLDVVGDLHFKPQNTETGTPATMECDSSIFRSSLVTWQNESDFGSANSYIAINCTTQASYGNYYDFVNSSSSAVCERVVLSTTVAKVVGYSCDGGSVRIAYIRLTMIRE